MRSLFHSTLSRVLLGGARAAESRLRSALGDKARVASLQERALARCLFSIEGSPVRQRSGIGIHARPGDLRRKGLIVEQGAYQELVHSTDFKPSFFTREGIDYFAISSGTSSATAKLFPITREYVRAMARMQKIYFLHRLALAGRHELSLGDSFMITALDMGTTHAGVRVNPMSRILYDLFKDPPLSKMRIRHVSEFFDDVSLELKPGTRLDDVRSDAIHSLFGMPPFVIMIFERLRERFGISSLREVWPNLAFYGHSGFDVTPYRARLRAILGADTLFFDGYAASEAVMGLQWKADEPDMVFLPHDTFYEFLCQRTGDRLLLHELREGDSYELLLTTPGGLLCYPLGDVVMVTGVDPVRFRVAGRKEEALRLTGEQVVATEVEMALRDACLASGMVAGNFVVVPRAEAGGYEVWFEWHAENPSGANGRTSDLGGDPNSRDRIVAEAFDSRLRELNSVYGLMRSSSLLRDPRVVPLRAGALDEVMLQGKRFGQGKFRRLYSSRDEVAERLAALEARRVSSTATSASTSTSTSALNSLEAKLPQPATIGSPLSL